jgi:hypothetical protein
MTFVKAGVLDFNSLPYFAQAQFKNSPNQKFVKRRPLHQVVKQSENNKRSKSVFTTQKLHNTLSIMGINSLNINCGMSSPDRFIKKINMIDIVSDFHRPNSMKFKLLKDTLQLLDRTSTQAGSIDKKDSFKLHSEIMKIILNKRRSS